LHLLGNGKKHYKMKKIFFILFSLFLVSYAYSKDKNVVVASTIRLPEQEILYNDGIDYLVGGEYEEAVAKFTSAITIDNKFANAYYNRAVAYYSLNKYSKANADIETALELIPEEQSADCHILKGKILYSTGNISMAKDELDKALSLNPASVNAQMDKGAIFQISKEYDKAIDIFSKLNYKTGGTAKTYNELGICYNNSGNYFAAYECFKKAYKADSTNELVKYNMALASWKVNKDTLNAIRTLDELINKNLENPDYYTAKGYILYQANLISQADYNFDNAIKINKNMASAYVGKALVALSNGLYKDASTFCDIAIEINTNYGEAYLNRGIAKEWLEDYSGACDDFSKASELGVKNAKDYYTRQCK